MFVARFVKWVCGGRLAVAEPRLSQLNSSADLGADEIKIFLALGPYDGMIRPAAGQLDFFFCLLAL